MPLISGILIILILPDYKRGKGVLSIPYLLENGFKIYRTFSENIMTLLFGNCYISNNKYYKILK